MKAVLFGGSFREEYLPKDSLSAFDLKAKHKNTEGMGLFPCPNFVGHIGGKSARPHISILCFRRIDGILLKNDLTNTLRGYIM